MHRHTIVLTDEWKDLARVVLCRAACLAAVAMLCMCGRKRREEKEDERRTRTCCTFKLHLIAGSSDMSRTSSNNQAHR